MTDSLFDHLPGVGEKRLLALIRHFGSAERLKGAGLADLRQVPGVGKDWPRRSTTHCTDRNLRRQLGSR